MRKYIDRAHKKEIVINDENLIKPQDLSKHIGEVLMFHNGSGYVVSAKLTAFNYEFDEFSFTPLEQKIEYVDELDMGMFYYPYKAFEIASTMTYASTICGQPGYSDEQIHCLLYVAKPTEEELAFRNKIMSYDRAWHDEHADYFDSLVDKYNEKDCDDLNCIGDLDEEDKKKINEIFGYE